MRKKLVMPIIFLMCLVYMMLNVQAASYTQSEVSASITSLRKQYEGTTWNRSYAGGKQCYAFAHFVFDTVFGRGNAQVGNGASSSNPTCYKLNNVASDINIIGTLAPGYSISNLEQLLEKAAPGDFIQVKRRTSGGPHSMIVVSVDPNSNIIEIFDANTDGKGSVKCYKQSFAEFLNKNSGVSVYRYKYYSYESIDHNPIGVLDFVEGGTNSFRVRGWAFDNDSKTEALDIHVYVGGQAGESGAIGYSIKADGAREDVGSTYSGVGNYHGYDSVIRTTKTGTQQVYVYAINKGQGTNVEIGHQAVYITSDTTPPAITNAKVTNIDNKSYTVECNVSDDSGIDWVKFPSWHSSKSGDDAVWYTGTVSNGVAKCTIPVKELGNLSGTYHTHIYATDLYGNQSVVAVKAEVDTTSIESVSGVNIGTGFTAHIENVGVMKNVTAESDGNVVSRSYTGTDSQKWIFNRNSDGTYTIVSVSTGKCLENIGGSGKSGTNVGINTANGSNSQKWYILANKKGSYYLRPKCSTECVLDLLDLNTSEGANIALCTFNATEAQFFCIIDEKKISERSKADLGSSFYASIANSTIKKLLSVDNANVVSKSDSGNDKQRWKFTKNTDGTYIIQSKADGRYLYNKEGSNNSNVLVSSTQQKWTLYETGDGNYYLQPASSSNCVLDLSDYNSNEGANISIHDFNSSMAQRYTITKEKISVIGVSLNASNVALTKKGETKQITATITPTDATDKGISWSSSNTSVATVNVNGMVTAVGNGSAVITAKTADGGKIANCNVNVAIPISVTGITLDKNELYLNSKGENQRLTSLITPADATNKTVRWESSNTSVAVVNTEGKVTAVANGTAIITATTVDGLKTASCNVTVSIPIPVTGLSLNQTSVQMDTIGGKISLLASIQPSNASNQFVAWSSNNTAVATVDEDGTVTAISEGTATITVISDDGGKKATCVVTVKKKNEHTHTYTKTIIKAATCKNSGTAQYTCKGCGETYTEPIAATGHIGKTIVKFVKEATCTENGYTGDTYCLDCGELLKKGTTVSSKGHQWDAGVVKQAATCTKDGEKLYTCSSCTITKKEPIAATGHIGKTTVKFVKEATCTENGYTGDTYCLDCGGLLKKGTTVSSKGHRWDAGVVKQSATCMMEGTKIYTCSSCETTKTEKIPKTEHQAVKDQAVSATCNATGKTEGSHCSVCKTVLVAQKTIPKTDHSWDAGRVIKQATCAAEGTKQYYCSVCGDTKEEKIGKAAHTVVTIKGAAATCTEKGKTDGEYCSICKTVLKEQKMIEAKGHQWDKGRVTKKATAYVAGEKTYTCSECGKITKEKIKATGGPAVGTQIKDNTSKAYYKITKANEQAVEVTFLKPLKKNSSKTVKIPDTITSGGIVFKVTAIDANAFKGDKKLTTLTIGKNVRTIGKSAFNGCKKLKKVTMNQSVTTIEVSAFYNCSALTSVTMSQKIITIGEKAFSKCAKLTSVTIPPEVKCIGKQAFYGCKKLKNILIKTEKLNDANVGSNAFKGIYSKASFKVPSSKMSYYQSLLKKKGASGKSIIKNK